MAYERITREYQKNAVNGSSPLQLVVMLYEGAIRFVRESISAIESKDFDRKRQSIDRAVAIVQHLHGTLDMDRGQKVATDLNRLYGYITTRILEGSAKLETAPLKEVVKLLNVLLAGWEELVNKEQNNTIPSPQLAQSTANGRFALHV